MADYKVVKLFTDLQDLGHLYEVGDKYPREGVMPSPERIAELSGKDNAQGAPLIKKIEEKKPAKKPAAKKTTKK